MQSAISALKFKGKSIGFVPTMGCLHAGHASLLKKCRKENDVSVLSIFVNPRQFSPQEDFKRYPRTFKKDENFAKKEKVDIIFHPSVDDMYPLGFLTSVEIRNLSEQLCGRFRPGHFQGVTTVVAKLLNIVSPHVLYLGQKDAQQAMVIQTMVKDLNFPTHVKVLPTIREHDGLALSSRNIYLSPEERVAARVLYQALLAAKNQIRNGEYKPHRIIQKMRSMILAKTSGPVDYIELVDASTLKKLKTLQGNVLIALAVWFGRARLIDNITIRI